MRNPSTNHTTPRHHDPDERLSAALASIKAESGIGWCDEYTSLRMSDSQASAAVTQVSERELGALTKAPAICKAMVDLYGERSCRIYAAWPYLIVVRLCAGDEIAPMSGTQLTDVIARTVAELTANAGRDTPYPLSQAVACEAAAKVLQTIAITPATKRPEITIVSGSQRQVLPVLDTSAFVEPAPQSELRRSGRHEVTGLTMDRDRNLMLALGASKFPALVSPTSRRLTPANLLTVFTRRTFLVGGLVRESKDQDWTTGENAFLAEESALDFSAATNRP